MIKTRKTIILIVLILITMAGIIYRIETIAKSADLRKQMTPLVKVERVQRQDMQILLDLNGDVQPIKQATIFSKVSGNLERNFVDMGSYVRENQLLAVIDSTELYQLYQLASATYTNACATYKRLKQLKEKQLASDQDVDNANASMLVAKANNDAAATRLSYASITAPFSGIISKRYLDPGALVNASSSTLFMLMSVGSVRIIVNVPEKDVPSVYHIHTARVTFDALPEKEFSGIVSLYSDAVDLSTRTMAVQINVHNPSRLIKPGMFATVEMIETEHKNAIVVPTNALVKTSDGLYVFTIKDKIAKRVMILVGIEQNSHSEILSGLNGDETIVTVGQQLIKDGASVTIQE